VTGENELVTLLTDIKESIERQMADGFRALTARFDEQALRMDEDYRAMLSKSDLTRRDRPRGPGAYRS
jgi:hypothetical protein